MQHQLTIDEYFHNLDLSNQPGRTAFIDECGNFGFDNASIFKNDGSSEYYVLCAIIVKNENLEDLVSKLDKIAKDYFNKSEMKSSSIGNNINRRKIILSEIMYLDFDAVVLIADKKKFIQDSPLTNYKDSFIKYLHNLLYESLYLTYPKLKIVEDEYGGKEFQIGFKKYVENNRPMPNLLNEYDFGFINSYESRVVQLADLLAGSINKHLVNKDSPNILKLLKSRIIDIVYFPKNDQNDNFNISSYNDYDNSIFKLATMQAYRYIEDNKKNINENIKLRVITLKYLLFEAKYISPTKFVTSNSILIFLLDHYDYKITRDFLFRNIIAPLRDDNVIISSCSKGYKIPYSLSDVHLYLDQTTNIVSPMLNRVQICRKLILADSNNSLDILSENQFLALRRYFDIT